MTNLDKSFDPFIDLLKQKEEEEAIIDKLLEEASKPRGFSEKVNTKDELIFLEDKILGEAGLGRSLFSFKKPNEDREKELLMYYTYIQVFLPIRLNYILKRIDEMYTEEFYNEIRNLKRVS